MDLIEDFTSTGSADIFENSRQRKDECNRKLPQQEKRATKDSKKTKPALKANYQGASPIDVAEALLRYNPKAPRSQKGE